MHVWCTPGLLGVMSAPAKPLYAALLGSRSEEARRKGGHQWQPLTSKSYLKERQWNQSEEFNIQWSAGSGSHAPFCEGWTLEPQLLLGHFSGGHAKLYALWAFILINQASIVVFSYIIMQNVMGHAAKSVPGIACKNWLKHCCIHVF